MWSGNQADGCDDTALVRCEFESGFGLRSFDGDVTTEDDQAPDAMRITAIRAEETEDDFFLHEADYASVDQLATSIPVADSDDWDDDDDDDDLHDDDDDDEEDDYLDDDDDLDADDDMDV